MKAGQDMQSANRKLLLRLKLCVPPCAVLLIQYLPGGLTSQQADLVVKAPKQPQQTGQTAQGSSASGQAHSSNQAHGLEGHSGMSSSLGQVFGMIRGGLGLGSSNSHADREEY